MINYLESRLDPIGPCDAPNSTLLEHLGSRLNRIDNDIHIKELQLFSRSPSPKNSKLKCA
jgi:hypothetical protein